ncbi:MAG: molybdopterin-dependent oxidoreductase [Hyphomonadaceae bacterium]|nr:molybdopterin-dependent oxidoreductase [Hyphomonadaceae bacterium]
MGARNNRPAETATTCPYCGVGCGVRVTPDVSGESASVRGDPAHPSNFGKLCSKGSALGETLSLEERLLYPSVDGKRADWDIALDQIAKGFSETIAEHGPDSVALYVSGQILTEDYYVANKLMKGFIGSANIDTNSRLCMASSVVGHKRAFGADTVPGCYEDLEEADLIVMVGSNLAWCHPILHSRILAARKKRGTRLVIIDPRKTATTDAADLHLPIRPGADVLLFNALFAHLAGSEAGDVAFVERYTRGLDEALAAIAPLSRAELARDTGIAAGDIAKFFGWFAETPRTVTIYSQGVNQSSAGSDKVNAILNCHLVTGRIGKPGCGPFSVTGQPNAMGGREVGGLANQLAAHMDFAPEDVDRVKRFWNAPNMATEPGLKAVDLFEAVHRGEVKALWIMATNPVVSLPDADRVKAAIAACPLVVVSEVVANSDTVKLANIALPATGWGEKTGTVTNSERRISRQRSFLKAPGEARHDWQAVCEVARRMGFDGFEFGSPADIYREYAALSAFENNDSRDFDIGADAEISKADYDALEPYQWPKPAGRARPGAGTGDHHRFFADGQFYTPDRRARFVATPYRPAASQPGPATPFILNTGRVRDHWHTMTRTGKSTRLSAHIAEPFLEVHPKDADKIGLAPASLAELTNAYGRAVLRVLITDRAQPGTVFAPMHWTDRYSSSGRVDALVAPNTDPVSGQPESKHGTVFIAPLKAAWFGFMVTREALTPELLSELDYWAVAKAGSGWRYELAGSAEMSDWLGKAIPADEALQLSSRHDQLGRALVQGDRLEAAIIASSNGPVEADRTWLAGLLDLPIDGETRIGLLAGRPAMGKSAGKIICSCLGVGSAAIQEAVHAGALSVDGIGAATGAGTNCGSCKPEIRAMLERFKAEHAQSQTIAAE